MDKAKRHADAALRAEELWTTAGPANPGHPYLVAKGVAVFGELRQQGERLVVPAKGRDGRLQTLQLIRQDGVKRFLTGGKVESGYFSIPAKNGCESGPLVVCEGYATAASIHEATGHACLVAFSAGNLPAVAKFARAQYPLREIILAADDDHETERKTGKNAGIAAATEAAREISAKVAVPRFVDRAGKSDFNDLAQAEGLEAVRAAEAVISHAPPSELAPDWRLARELFPRTPFPWEVLSHALASSLKQLARSCAASSTPLVGTMLCLIASALGRMVEVRPKSSWGEPLIFWCFDLRETGDCKTAGMWALAHVFQERQAKEEERYRRDMEEHNAKPKKDRGEEPPKPRGYFSTDCTLEGLRTDLAEHPTGGLVLLLNEASQLVSSQGQYKGGKGSDREAWLSLWDGRSARIVRSSGSVHLAGARVQVCGGVQPEVFRQMFGGDNGILQSDGTIFRGLYNFEPSAHFPLTRESWSQDARDVWSNILNRAFDWADGRELAAFPDAPTLRLTFSDEAYSLFMDWRNGVDVQKADLPKLVKGFIPKSVSQAARLAGALHCLRAFHEGREPSPTLEAEDVQAGIRLATYYLGQAVDAVRLLSSKEEVRPQEVSERTMRLAEALASLRPQVENGRLAVGLVAETFNAMVGAEGRMTPHAMGALLRSVGLEVPPNKYNANGRRGVFCVSWDAKTERYLKQSPPCPPYPPAAQPCGFSGSGLHDAKSAKSAGCDDAERTSADKADFDFQSPPSATSVVKPKADKADKADFVPTCEKITPPVEMWDGPAEVEI